MAVTAITHRQLNLTLIRYIGSAQARCFSKLHANSARTTYGYTIVYERSVSDLHQKELDEHGAVFVNPAQRSRC